MGGNTYPILNDLLSTGTSYLVSNVETNQNAFVERVARTHPQVRVRVNMNPGIVACPDPKRIYHEIDRVLAFAGGTPNCLLGTGALPFETPPENIRLIKELPGRLDAQRSLSPPFRALSLICMEPLRQQHLYGISMVFIWALYVLEQASLLRYHCKGDT